MKIGKRKWWVRQYWEALKREKGFAAGLIMCLVNIPLCFFEEKIDWTEALAWLTAAVWCFIAVRIDLEKKIREFEDLIRKYQVR